MDEATLGRWYKQVGDDVVLDEPVAEMETDKVTDEIYSQTVGRIVEILVLEGATVVAGEVLARVETPDEDTTRRD